MKFLINKLNIASTQIDTINFARTVLEDMFWQELMIQEKLINLLMKK